MNNRQSNQQTTSMFSKKTTIVKNVVPITLKMIKDIDPNTRQLQNILQVNKVVILAKVINVNHKLGGKLQIQIRDQTPSEINILHYYRPKYANEEIVLNQAEYYKFVCIVKADHGQIVLNCIKFKKVQDFNEITNFNLSVIMAHTYRQKMRLERQNQTEYEI